MAVPLAQYEKSGIKVVVVGGGFGGLTAAIECHFKGHDVQLIDKCFSQMGDIISLGPNAGQILSRWDPEWIAEKLRPICMNNDRFKIHTHTGEVIVEQIVPPIEGKPAWNGHRAEIQNVLFEYAVSLGIPIKMGKKVVEWKEDGQSAWVVLDDGEIVKGDLVVAANGLMSKAKAVILASHNQSNSEDDISHLCREKSSGYSVYRAWYDATEMGIDKDPLTKVFAERDTHMGWLGKDVHFLVASMKEGKAISWVATHRATKTIDLHDDGEDWMNPTKGIVAEAVQMFEDWDPICKAIVEKTASCIDFPLIIRDPLPTWISSNGRICLLGDGAHAFLPTSIQGASQAMEDGVVLAIVLSLTKFSPSIPEENKVQTALKAYQKLRMERVKSAQKTGVEVMELWHAADWEKVKQNPESMKLPRDDWLLLHDCEKWTRGIWDEALEELRGGKKIPRERLAAGEDSTEVFYF